MPKIYPFKAIRPTVDSAANSVCLPYDVLSRQEASQQGTHRDSFLHITRAEIDLPDSVDQHDPQVHQQAKQNLAQALACGTLIQEETPYLYLYLETWRDHRQLGVVACLEVADYLNGKIKRHENTLAVKEADRIAHFETVNAQTEPIFLTYQAEDQIDKLCMEVIGHPPLLQGDTPDGVHHELWRCSSAVTEQLQGCFEQVEHFYIADGHHRAASAAKVASQRPGKANAPWNRLMAVLVPDHDLTCLPYNRIIRDWGDTSCEEFFDRLNQVVRLTPSLDPPLLSQAGTFAVFGKNRWWKGEFLPTPPADSPVSLLDVSRLQDQVLSPLLGIKDPRTDPRIDFVGGIKGPDFLAEQVRCQKAVLAFSLYPTQVSQVMAVAEAEAVMPPKSTWFEPKLASGLFAHSFQI